MQIDESMERLVSAFKSLPGVGYKTAQRYAYYIIDHDKQVAQDFADAIVNAKEKIKYCKECGNFTDLEVCPICQSRNKKIICVVKEPKDVLAIEKVKNYDGVYHVLHGTISPLENRGPNDIRIKELIERVTKNNVSEVIMATNPDVEGDVTAHYIAKLLKPLSVKCTRLAQGISIGSDIEYADEVTLSKALESRNEIWYNCKKY